MVAMMIWIEFRHGSYFIIAPPLRSQRLDGMVDYTNGFDVFIQVS